MKQAAKVWKDAKMDVGRAGLNRASNRAFGHRLLSEDRGSHLTPGF